MARRRPPRSGRLTRKAKSEPSKHATIPMGASPLGDQPMNLASVAAARAGVVAPLDGLGQAIELVLADERYRVAARRAAAEMRSAPAVDGFLDLV